MQKTTLVALGIAIVGVAYWAGTKRTESSVEKAPAGVTSTTAVAAPAPSAAPPKASSDRSPLDMSGLDGLGEKLAAEKAASGRSNPSAGAVFKAIEEKLKMPLEGTMQPLASMVGATYCERRSTKSEVYVVVCEYADEAAAKKGQAAATNNVVKRREVLQHKSATAAIHQSGDSKDAEADAKRIKDLFATP